MTKYEEKRQARIERLRTRAAKKHEFADNNGFDLFSEEKSGIPFGQPLVGSPQRMRQQRNHRERIARRIDRGMEARQYAQELERRADAAEDRTAIDSDDPQAIEKLQAKIDSLRASDSEAKQLNAIMRKFKTHSNALKELEGKTDETSKRLFEYLSNHWIRTGWASPPDRISAYYFGFNSPEIRRCEKRLNFLKRAKESGPIEFEINNVKVLEVEGQIQIHFPDKPDSETRQRLKTYPISLKWSRYSQAWVRKKTQSTQSYWISELKSVLESVKYEGGL